MNLYEIHCHTKEVSACAYVKAKKIVQEHHKLGFKGICITDHYFEGFFDSHKEKTDEQIVNEYLKGYKSAKEEGDKLGLNVMLGMELRFVQDSNDYLVFGMDEQFIYDNPRMFEMSINSFVDFIKNTDILIVWAHPFRNNITMKDHHLFEAIESFNGNIRQDSRNILANQYMVMHNLVGTCGSDYHKLEDINISPMLFDYEIKNTKQLVKAIRNNNFKHKINYWSNLK